MKSFFKFVLAIFLAAIFTGCAADLGEVSGDQKLIISVDPDPGNSLVRAMGTTYNFNVVLQSRVPANGTDFSVVYRQDLDNAVVFSQNYSTTSSILNVSITNMPFNEIGTVTIVATSKSNPANTDTKSFKLVRK